MIKKNKFRIWLWSHPWIYALLAFIGVPVCFLLTQLVMNRQNVMSAVKQLIPHAILSGWVAAILILIIIKIMAPIVIKITIACLISLPPYVIYRLIDQPKQILDNPLLDASYLVILGATISYVIVKVERSISQGKE
jgi:hypothetical protein